jgi:hypothetical protein
MLDRQRVLTADDLPRVEVSVPEWGGTLLVRTMTGAQRARWEDAWSRWQKNAGGDSGDFYAMLMVHALVNPDGSPMFTEGDIPALSAKSGKVLHQLYRDMARVNGIGAEAVEQAEKNSGGAPTA